MPLSPRQADGAALPFPGLEGVRSEEGEEEEGGQVITPAAESGTQSQKPPCGGGPRSGRTAGTHFPNKHTSTHPTNERAQDRSQDQKGSHRPAPAPQDGVCVLPHLYAHPTSPACTQPPGWPWLAALRQDVTVCLPRRTSGHLAFAAQGSCVILATSRGDSGSCRADSRRTAAPHPPRPVTLCSCHGASGQALIPSSPRGVPFWLLLSPSPAVPCRAPTSPTSKSSQGCLHGPRSSPSLHTCPPPGSPAQVMMAPQASPLLPCPPARLGLHHPVDAPALQHRLGPGPLRLVCIPISVPQMQPLQAGRGSPPGQSPS